ETAAPDPSADDSAAQDPSVDKSALNPRADKSATPTTSEASARRDPTLAKVGSDVAKFLICSTPFCGIPPSVSLASYWPGTITYSSSSVTECWMSYWDPWSGASDTWWWPPNASDTVGAGSGYYYWLTCQQSFRGYVRWSDTQATWAL